MPMKISGGQFEELHTKVRTIDEQIDVLKAEKYNAIAKAGITKQAYYSRLRTKRRLEA